MRRVMKMLFGSSLSRSVRWERSVSFWGPAVPGFWSGDLEPGAGALPRAPCSARAPRFLALVAEPAALLASAAVFAAWAACCAGGLPCCAAASASRPGGLGVAPLLESSSCSILQQHSCSRLARLRCAHCARDAALADCSCVKLLRRCGSLAMRPSSFSIATRSPLDCSGAPRPQPETPDWEELQPEEPLGWSPGEPNELLLELAEVMVPSAEKQRERPAKLALVLVLFCSLHSSSALQLAPEPQFPLSLSRPVSLLLRVQPEEPDTALSSDACRGMDALAAATSAPSDACLGICPAGPSATSSASSLASAGGSPPTPPGSSAAPSAASPGGGPGLGGSRGSASANARSSCSGTASSPSVAPPSRSAAWNSSTWMATPPTTCSGPCSRILCAAACDFITTRPKFPGRVRGPDAWFAHRFACW
mmetsp:Transcript_8608/g.24215  ORF Transcript_8608/g.24215 Transcript_8608/m.24215 type:complete len:422 (-) Transcript_8608:594-1859(-)